MTVEELYNHLHALIYAGHGKVEVLMLTNDIYSGAVEHEPVLVSKEPVGEIFGFQPKISMLCRCLGVEDGSQCTDYEAKEKMANIDPSPDYDTRDSEGR